MSAAYCHCYPVLGCDAATAEVEGPDGWYLACERCMGIAFDAGHRVHKLVPVELRPDGWDPCAFDGRDCDLCGSDTTCAGKGVGFISRHAILKREEQRFADVVAPGQGQRNP